MSSDSLTIVADAGPVEIDREWAISMFGATYVHEGDHHSPIIELIGRHDASTQPTYSDCLFFRKEEDAVRHVRAMARAAAESDLKEADRFLKGRLTPTSLWIARNIPATRNHFRSLLSIDEITSLKRRRAEQVLKRGFDPSIRRTRQMLRMPLILKDDMPVFVVDHRRFMRQEKRIRESRVLEKIALPASGNPFDAVVRYRIEDVPGLAAFDTTDRRTRRLRRYPDSIEVFLTRTAAERYLALVCDRIDAAVDHMRAQISQTPDRLEDEQTPLQIGELHEGGIVLSMPKFHAQVA